jgi:hypothetical protein
MTNAFDIRARLKFAMLCCAFICGVSTATLTIVPFTFV